MLTTVVSVLIVLIAVIFFLAAVMIFRAMLFGSPPQQVDPVELQEVDAAVVAEHLGEVIRHQTESNLDRNKVNPVIFEKLHSTLERLYPCVHGALQCEKINGSSILFTWAGRARELDPVLISAHLDVVPVSQEERAQWTHPPFSGQVADGCVWGRGALDLKGTVVAVLEAVEGLLRAGYQPERTLYISLGHDEEIGGWKGARSVAALLEERLEELRIQEDRDISLAAVLDEGGFIFDEMVPGMSLPAALVGVAEKGAAVFELRVEGKPGHSSIPSRHTVIGILAQAIARLEAAPMPVDLTLARMMFRGLGAFLPFGLRFALANEWLFGGSIRKRLEANPQTNSLIRTTAAPTLIQGGTIDNVLPAQAKVLIGCRVLPGETCETVKEMIRQTVQDEAVQISMMEEFSWEPPLATPTNTPVYESLGKVIRQVFPEAVVAPYLVPAATDSRYYTALSGNVLRFTPLHMNPGLLKSIHGIDERVPVESLGRMVQFYSLLIKTWTTVVGTTVVSPTTAGSTGQQRS